MKKNGDTRFEEKCDVTKVRMIHRYYETKFLISF